MADPYYKGQNEPQCFYHTLALLLKLSTKQKKSQHHTYNSTN